MKRIVIAGAGHAGVECAAQLRQNGFSGQIHLISNESSVPYQRPPLSKDYIKRPGSALVLRPTKFFEDNDITLALGHRVWSINRGSKSVSLDDGSRLDYDHLVLATGARNRNVTIDGLDGPYTFELRTLQDADRIALAVQEWQRIIVLGGGFIGLEAAALLADMGKAVDVLEAAPRLLQRAVSPLVSQWFLDWHRSRGVRIHLQTQARLVKHGSSGVSVLLNNDLRIEADALLVAVGVVPNSELAEAAGLKVDNGIVVDSLLRTSDPSIYAIGDCASFPSRHLSSVVRLESVQNAVDQARCVAASLVGDVQHYGELPWFWSVQGNARLQIVGLASHGAKQVVRGDPAEGKFSVFLFEDERLTAVESVNAAGDHIAARRILAAGKKFLSSDLANNGGDLKAIAMGAG